ncbi:MAG TPA: class I SAM-dependent methyltransferase [Pirellulales bacterium]|nr:class I SAM-dependent methyltransferase [Pirellulales bacterium]
MSTLCRPLFDAYSETYDDVLNAAISASGETKDYFARGRMEWLATRLRGCAGPVRSVLDYGCGTGTSTPLFFDILGVQRVLGVDVSSASLEVAARRYGSPATEFRLVDEHATTSSVDLAFTNGVFHHIAPGDRPAAVDHMIHSLRPGGWLAFWENNAWNPGTRYCMWVNPFDRDAVSLSPVEAVRLLNQSGLQIVETTYTFVFPRALHWLRPLEPRLCRLPLGAQFLILARKPGPGPVA